MRGRLAKKDWLGKNNLANIWFGKGIINPRSIVLYGDIYEQSSL